MQLTELSEQNKQQYNTFVASQGGSFLQGWEWGQWQAALDKTVVRTALIDDDIVGTCQWIKLPPSRLPVWYAPRGPVMDGALLREFVQLHAQHFKNALAIRVEPPETWLDLQITGKKMAASQPEKTLIVNLAESADTILAQMHEKTRYNIRVAQRHGVLVRAVPAKELSNADTKLCLDLLDKTGVRQGFQNHSRSYFGKFLQFFADLPQNSSTHAVLYFAEHEGTPLCCGVMVDFAQTRIYLYGGSDDIKRNLMAPYLLHWQAMLDAKQAGLRSYDLGGSETLNKKTAGFTRFKSGFGGTELTYPGTFDIPLRPLLHRAYTATRTINRLRRHIF